MIKETIKFVDYEGEDRTQIAYFNLTKVELMRLSAKYAPKSVDLEAVTKIIVDRGDVGEMLSFIEDMILSAYGERDNDGVRFVKNPRIRAEFENSLAYAQLFEDLLGDDGNRIQTFAKGLYSDNSAKKPLAQAPRG